MTSIEIAKRQDPCSVELSRNAKGELSWTLKIYADEADMDRAITKVREMDARLKTWARDEKFGPVEH